MDVSLLFLVRHLHDFQLTSLSSPSPFLLPKATSSRRSSGLGSTVFESIWIFTPFLGLKMDGVSYFAFPSPSFDDDDDAF